MLAGELSDTYAAALVEAIAREEIAGRRSARLTEPGQATWQRFRGRLGNGDLLRLLAEDGAVVHLSPSPRAASACRSMISMTESSIGSSRSFPRPT